MHCACLCIYFDGVIDSSRETTRLVKHCNLGNAKGLSTLTKRGKPLVSEIVLLLYGV